MQLDSYAYKWEEFVYQRKPEGYACTEVEVWEDIVGQRLQPQREVSGETC